MDLSTSNYRAKGLLTLTDGRQFRGTVNVNTVLRTQNDIAQYLLHVGLNSFVQPGQAVIYNGLKFLLGRGVTEFFAEALFRELRMVQVDEEELWTRVKTAVDPISGLPKSSGTTTLGTALFSRLATSGISDTFHTSDSKYAIITNSVVQPDDRLGPYIVTFTETRHGLQYAEVR